MMLRRSPMRSIAWLCGLLLLLLSACSDGRPCYHHYETVAEEGLDKEDSVVLVTDSVKEDGSYGVELCLRTSARYPYRFLALKTRVKVLPDGPELMKNLRFEVKHDNGANTGEGMIYFTHEQPFAQLALKRGDSLRMVVRHNMRRQVMPGVVSVGLKVIDN